MDQFKPTRELQNLRNQLPRDPMSAKEKDLLIKVLEVQALEKIAFYLKQLVEEDENAES